MGTFITLSYVLAALLFIMGVRLLRSPTTARAGNSVAALGMLIALVVTLLDREIISYWQMALAALVGAVIGAVSARRVPMTAMPQMVAAFNGVGGGAVALIGIAEFYQFQSGQSEGGISEVFFVLAGVLIGSISFAGSTVAFGKLQELFLTGAITYPLQKTVNAVILVVVLGFMVNVLVGGAVPLVSIGIIFALSLVLGIILVIPIGGADMPIVISLLNSFTGLAAAMSGFLLHNEVLIIAGALVGASGTILTRLMSSSLGRPLGKIIFAGVGAGAAEQEEKGEEKPVTSANAEDVAATLSYDADKVIFVPGYGLAVAQAQQIAADLVGVLEEQGKDVKFAIHPVAGRMPGHMNVLLADAGVSYDRLYDMDEINDEFAETDAVIIVGANDVVNPVAQDKTRETPITGMPILQVEQAKRVVFVKRSLSPGFAGVDNPLFYETEKTMMFFTDAKQGLQDILNSLQNV